MVLNPKDGSCADIFMKFLLIIVSVIVCPETMKNIHILIKEIFL